MKRPAFQFYPGDHLRSVRLGRCSLEAQGLWMRLQCIMHDGDPYGYLAADGEALEPADIARMSGVSIRTYSRLIRELVDRGVAVEHNGKLCSPRMVRDEELREVRAAGGHRSLQHPNVPRRKDREKDILPGGSMPPSPSSSSSSSSSTEEENYVLSELGQDVAKALQAEEPALPGLEPEPEPPRKAQPEPRKPSWLDPFHEDWRRFRKGVPPYGVISKAVKTADDDLRPQMPEDESRRLELRHRWARMLTETRKHPGSFPSEHGIYTGNEPIWASNGRHVPDDGLRDEPADDSERFAD